MMNATEGSEGERRATLAKRQWVVEMLCEAYAQDQLGIQELERRLDDANRVRSERELRALVADLTLPKGMEPTVPATTSSTGFSVGSVQQGSVTRWTQGADSEQLSLRRIDAAQVPDRQLSVGVWSGRVRKGSWVPARRITALALQGGVELDFREALFGPGPVEVSAIAVMGGIQIIVPPNLRVETSGFAIAGGLEDRSDYPAGQHPGGPILRIRGFAVFGGIDIDVRLPGETGRQARGRRRKARRGKRR